MLNSSILLLANGIGGPTGDATAASKEFFFNTPVGAIVKGVLVAIGVIVLLITAVSVAKNLQKSKAGDAVKVGLGGVVGAVFLFFPEMIIGLVNIVGGLLAKVFESISQIIGK